MAITIYAVSIAVRFLIIFAGALHLADWLIGSALMGEHGGMRYAAAVALAIALYVLASLSEFIAERIMKGKAPRLDPDDRENGSEE